MSTLTRREIGLMTAACVAAVGAQLTMMTEWAVPQPGEVGTLLVTVTGIVGAWLRRADRS